MRVKELKVNHQSLFKVAMVLLIAGVMLAAFAPSEKVIGKVLGLVYLHIGFFAGSLILLCLVLILGLISFFKNSRKILNVIGAFYRIAFGGWFIYFLLSAAIAYLSWGHIFWQEPRMVIAVRVLFIFLLCFALNGFLERKYEEKIYFFGALFSILIWIFRYSIMHPKAPIRNSDVASIKIMALFTIFLTAISLITLAFAVAGKEMENDSL